MFKTEEEIKDMLVGETINLTNLYFKTNKNKGMNRELWAWFHLGVLATLKWLDYPEDKLNKALEMAQKELGEFLKEVGIDVEK